MSTPAPRIPRPGEQPEVLVHRPAIRDAEGRWRQPVFDDADHRAAKSGDFSAARRFVLAYASHEVSAAIHALLAGRQPRVVSVHAEEKSGRNAIPTALADVLTVSLGGVGEAEIVQVCLRHGSATVSRH